MKNFLLCVAEAYAARMVAPAGAAIPADRYCFVFPNKRACTFFLKHLRSALSRLIRHSAPENAGVPEVFLAPQTLAITDFVSEVSGRLVETRINILFLLYNCYRAIFLERAPDARPEDVPPFDAFRRWGETVLADFNEIDMHLADPEALYENLADFRTITSTFLTEEQKRVLEEYFGYNPIDSESERFWVDFNRDNGNSETRRKFVRIWQILHPLYKRFTAALEARGATSAGGAYRLAARVVEEDPSPLLKKYDKIVFVGFNALSGAERRIFKALRDLESSFVSDAGATPFAEFVWDAAGPVINNSGNSAGRFVHYNIRHFPAPTDVLRYLAQADPGNHMPQIEAVASPSKVMQVKIAAHMITDLRRNAGADIFRDANVALVLPDESLLMPMLHSLPPNVKNVNLTMGYPLKLTSIGSFMALVRRMQLIRRDSSKYKGYAYEEVSNLLSHPYAQRIIGARKIADFRLVFEKKHISVVKDSDLPVFLGERGAELLAPIPLNAPASDVIAYLDRILAIAEESFAEDYPADVLGTSPGAIERLHLRAWRDALQVFDNSIREFGISMNPASTMAEAYRLLQGEIVAFEGEPLSGLQIMGLLETRSLDFEEVLITSVNERILPRRQRSRSFIPNVIRRGYGLPPMSYSENLFSYYFYRLLSRARKVTLIYDARATATGGGISRYLMQLRYVHTRPDQTHGYSPTPLKDIEYRFTPQAPGNKLLSVNKTADIVEALHRYSVPVPDRKGQKNISASLLKKYLDCPVRFLLTAIEGICDDPLPSEGVNDIAYGNIIHKAMEEIYLPPSEVGKGRFLDKPVNITTEFIDAALKNHKRIYALVRKLININHYDEREQTDRELGSDTEIVAEAAITQIRAILRHDRSMAPFNIYGCEIDETFLYKASDGKEYNVRYAIDRMDDAGVEAGVRIVDYKTGASHTQAFDIDEVFSSGYSHSHLFQLLFYTLMLNERRALFGQPPLAVTPLVYPVAKIFDGAARNSARAKLGVTILEQLTPDSEVMTQFRLKLDEVLSYITDPDIPFEALYSPSTCANCPFADICRHS